MLIADIGVVFEGIKRYQVSHTAVKVIIFPFYNISFSERQWKGFISL